MIKELQDISRQEWVAYRWIEIPPVMGDSDEERMFRSVGHRTPDESYQALEEWVVTAEDRGCAEPESETEKGSVQ
jgi:hypothetical protein